MVFVFRVPIQVRFRVLDSLNHVNNAVYVTYLEFARIAYWNALLKNERPSMLVARVEMDYLRPVLLHDVVEVLVRTSEIGTKSFTMRYEILANGEVAARGSTVQVWFDHTAQISKSVPDAIRAKVLEFEPAVTERLRPA